MIFLAALVGAFIPVCGITVLPLVAGLLVARVPLAPILAFWLSSPITSPGMLAVTAGTLGLDFAIGKSLGALFIGVTGGLVVYAITRLGGLAEPARDIARLKEASGQLCASGLGLDGAVRWRFWREVARRRQFARTALSTGRLIGTWLTVAFVAEYYLKRVLPENALAGFVGSDSPFAVPIAATVGAPIYLDGLRRTAPCPGADRCRNGTRRGNGLPDSGRRRQRLGGHSSAGSGAIARLRPLCRPGGGEFDAGRLGFRSGDLIGGQASEASPSDRGGLAGSSQIAGRHCIQKV